MKKRFLKIGVIFLVLLLVGGVAAYFLSREPKHNGKTVSEWVEQLKASDLAKKKEAEEAILALGPEALPVLTAKAHGMHSRARTLAKKSAEMLPQALERRLRKLFGNGGEAGQTRAMALHAIRRLGTNAEPALPSLIRLLRDPDSLVSYQAALTLHRMPAAVPSLIEALDESNFQTRANTFVALQGLGESASNAAPRLLQILNSETGPPVASASYTLSRIGPPAIPVLTNGLKHTNVNVRHWSAVALGNMDALGLAAVPALCEAASDVEVQVRSAAITALRKIDRIHPEADKVMLAALDDPRPGIQLEAMEALVFRPRAVRAAPEKIEAILDHPNPHMRRLAKEALDRLKTKESSLRKPPANRPD